MSDNKKKPFKDMLGHDITLGDKVLHLYLEVDWHGNVRQGKTGVKNKLATVVKICPKSIRLRHEDAKKTESVVMNTKNRIIVVNNNELVIQDNCLMNHGLKQKTEELEAQYSINKQNQRELAEYEKDLREISQKNVDFQRENLNLKEKIKEMETTLDSVLKERQRFEMMDL